MKFYRDSYLDLNFFKFSRVNSLKNWLYKKSRILQFSRSTWSILNIIKLYKSKHSSKKKIKVLLPIFYCADTVEQISNHCHEVHFYSYNNDSTVDLNDLTNKIHFVNPDILIYSHFYFSFLEVNQIKKILDNSKIWIIEDCVQFFIPNKYVGLFGDFIIYSPYKFIPVYELAILVFTKKSSRINIINHSTMTNNLKLYRLENALSFLKNLFKVLKFVFKQILLKFGLKKIKFVQFEGKVNPSKLSQPKPTIFSLVLFNSANIDQILIQRQLNFKILMNFIKQIDREDLFDISKYVKIEQVFYNCDYYPLTFPLFLKNKKYTIYFYENLIKNNFEVNSWPDLPLDKLDGESYITSSSIKHCIIHFPINHNVSYSNNSLNKLKKIFNHETIN